MKSLHWSNFIPSTSKIDGFIGGIYPEYEWADINSASWGQGFSAVSYRLQVAEAENGFHHFMAMYTALQGVAYANAVMKEALLPGYYQFTMHFSFPKPHVAPSANNLGNSYQGTMFFGQDSEGFGTPANGVYGVPVNFGTSNSFGADANYPAWMNNKKMDLMVLRPSLVDPTDANVKVDLWDKTAYDGIQMYFTGYPIADPGLVQSSDYDL